MTTVKNMKELEKLLQQRISKALQQNVANTVKQVMKEKIEEEVYSVYEPVPTEYGGYERQRERGGLLDEENMEVKMLNENTLSIENVRSDNGKNVAETVITGKGYDYDFPYNDVPRDFIEATREELRNTNEHVASMYQGLKRID